MPQRTRQSSAVDPRGQPERAGVRPALQARSQEKRDRLLLAGLKVFGDVGYEAARVADIAAAAGLSVGVFYQRFHDKRAFFASLQDEFTQLATQYMAHFLAELPADCSANDCLRQLIKHRARQIQQYVGFFRGLVALAHHEPALLAPSLRLDAAMGELLYSHMRSHGLLPAHIDAARVHTGLTTTTRALVLTALLTGPEVRLDDLPLCRQLAEMLCGYLELVPTPTHASGQANQAGGKPRRHRARKLPAS